MNQINHWLPKTFSDLVSELLYPSPNSFHQIENETKMDTAQYFKLVVKTLVKPRITGWPPCTFRPFVSDKWRTPGIRVPFSPPKYPFNFSCCCWPDAPAFGQTFGADTFIGLVAKMQAKAFFLFHFFLWPVLSKTFVFGRGRVSFNEWRTERSLEIIAKCSWN